MVLAKNYCVMGQQYRYVHIYVTGCHWQTWNNQEHHSDYDGRYMRASIAVKIKRETKFKAIKSNTMMVKCKVRSPNSNIQIERYWYTTQILIIETTGKNIFK